MGCTVSSERGSLRPSPDLIDILIAGTAKAHNLAIATRNVRDFQGMDIGIVNPWDYP